MSAYNDERLDSNLTANIIKISAVVIPLLMLPSFARYPATCKEFHKIILCVPKKQMAKIEIGKFKKILIFLVFFLAITNISSSQKKKFLQIQKVSMEYNKEYIWNYTLRLYNDNTTADLEVFMPKTLTKPLWFKLMIEMKMRQRDDYNQIMSYEFNVCDAMTQATQPLLKTWIDNVAKYGNLPSSCPFKEGIYYVRNFKFDRNSLPQFLLKAFYGIHGLGYFRQSDGSKNILYNVSAFVSLKTK
ncbi:uncharacterized protein LOC131995820 [Stomoxys calcitrans]|uniref:uncharacterized protein LOC131995820 n=1 Tax=Stomoxys calcitrans TaxID=35570 RepID=UPI0027E31872|nr:uncharacterized protein LOC131995820 [Stomoxys calcitrans]